MRKMLDNYFHNLGWKLIGKAARWILVAVIALITWLTVISPSTHRRGRKLYEQGKQLYEETKESSHNTSYQISRDSSAIYITIK
jgi:hypothetical protein